MDDEEEAYTLAKKAQALIIAKGEAEAKAAGAAAAASWAESQLKEENDRLMALKLSVGME